MAKLTLTDITAGYDTATVNAANNLLIETALENTLSRDGTSPNQMEANLDMNSYRIQNLPTAVNNTEPVILSQANTLAGVDNPLTQNSIGTTLWPQTAAETSAAITPTNYYYEPGDVRRYGATLDGTTDDSTALQDAGNSTHCVYIPDGTLVADNISWSTDVEIKMDDNAKILHKASSTTNLITSSADLRITGGIIDGNKANITSRLEAVVCTGTDFVCIGVHFQNTIQTAIRVTGVTGVCIIRDCHFTGMAEHGGSADQISACIDVESSAAVQVVISGCRFVGDTPSTNLVAPGGIQLSGTSISSRVTNNYFKNIGQNNTTNSNYIGCVDTYTDADESIIIGNVFIDSYLSPLKLQNARNLSCANNIVEGYSGAGTYAMIVVQNARSYAVELQNISITGNVVDINGDTTNQCMTIDGQAGGAYDTRYVTVTGNIFRGGDEGLRLKQFDKVSIVGNVFEGTGTHAIEANEMGDDGPHINIAANTFANIGGICVFFPVTNNSDNLNIAVTGNLLDGTSGTPTSFCQIRGESGFTLERVIVSNNLIKGSCSSADIDIQWADTAVVTGNISDGNSDNLSAGNITTLVATANSWVETSAYTPTNVSTDRAFDADTVAVAELADVVGTLIADLQTQGVIS